MRVVYYADDGTEFESEKECREYEKKTANLLNEFTNNIHAYNEDGNPVNLKDYDMEYWEAAFQEITYIQFDTQKAIDCFMEHSIREYGLVDIASYINRDVKPGERYFYNWDEDEWACLEDKQKELDRVTAVFVKKIIKE